MQVNSLIHLLATLLPILLLLFGAIFMKIGFWPRRRGDTPHCSGCGYALVGNQSGTCPECGRPFDQSSVVRGERNRRNGLGASGAVLLLLGLALGAGIWLADINWHQYMPQWLVVTEAASSDSKVAERAWDELLRRRSTSGLSESVERKLTDLALKEQASASPSVLVDPMLQFVGQRFLDKKLTDAQTEQFFLNTINPTLKTRAIVAAGDLFPVQVAYRGRGPTNGWSYSLSTKDVQVGSTTIHMGGSMGGSGLGGSGSSTSWAPGQPAGEYPLVAHVGVKIFHTPLGGTAPPVWSKDLTLKSTLKVIAQDSTEMVKLVDKPELAEQIKKSLRIEQLTKKPDGTYDMQVHIEKPPLNLAFSVFLRSGGKEFRMGDIAGNTTSNMGTFMHPSKATDVPPGKVQIIFRSDPAVARKTIDLVEIWKGEIALDAELKQQGK